MQAAQQNLSSIKVHFGKPLNIQQNLPLSANLELHLFSQEEKSIRQTIESRINKVLPNTSVVLELTVANGSAETLAASLQQLSQGLIPQDAPVNVEFLSSGNLLYLIISGQILSGLVEGYQLMLKQASAQAPGAEQDNQNIHIHLLSKNSVSQIRNLAKSKNVFSLLDSLSLQFQFLKTKLASLFVCKVIEQITMDSKLTSLINSFKQFNFEFNCASSSFLDEFPKINFLQQVDSAPLSGNPIADKLKESGIEQMKLYLLNSSLLVTGSFRAVAFGELISSLQG